jgi:hypothetical protein
MSVDTETKPSTLSDRLAGKKPVERLVTIFLDGETVDELQKAVEAHAVLDLKIAGERLRVLTEWSTKGQIGDVQAILDAFDKDAAKRLKPALKAVQDAEDAVRDTSVDIHFRSMGRQAFAELEREHQPTDEDHAQLPDGQQAQYHAETWAPALIEASSELTKEEVATIFRDFNQTEINELYIAAIWVNSTKRVAELGKARG